MNQGISKKKYFMLLSYMILLLLSYGLFIEPVFNMRNIFNDFNLIKFVESIIIFTILLMFLPRKLEKPSDLSTNILFLLMVIPLLSLYCLHDENRIFLYFYVTSFFLTLVMLKVVAIIKLKFIKGLDFFIFVFVLIITLYTYGLLFKLNGLPSLKTFNLLKVYEVRSSVNYGGDLLIKMSSWQARIVNSFLLLVAYEKKSKKMFLAVIILQIILYLYVGHKSFLFFPIYISSVYYGVKRKKIIELIVLGLSLLVVISLVSYYCFDNIIIGSLFIRRFVFVPAQNSFYYYDFFSKNHFNFMSNSYLQWFFDSPIYDERITTMIGRIYYGKPLDSVNTGYLAEAYMNFGYLGMAFFSLLISLLFTLMDSISLKSKSVIPLVLMASVIYIMVDSSFMVALTSHGIFMSVVISYLYTSNVRRFTSEGINDSSK